ncbi:ABC transporter substrate-binding protein [Thermanaerothrix sp. 4228-RoL]|uniref:ABC transporter substrate-binding protein n=1 Tax=Thermanaerothrix solaris TaxID=3058434 RepID=A0ABU3NQ81_9CHLR|nr:ABC transporter substrate-binding protein [Thermanaerothrix sp. 4228-RoL]MDT8898202.1 ABC transporter substrate-binding protein [Thermanaerothrix sp. 4228-RoL]
MNKKPAWLSFVGLLVIVSLLFSACSPGQKPPASSSPTEAPAEIHFAFLSFNKIPETDALASVEEAINAITVPKINATVKLHPFSVTDYAQQVTLLLQSGEGLDVYHTLGDLPQRVANNEFIDISTMIDQYAPETKALVGDDFLKTATLHGKLYGIPAYKGMAMAPQLVYRADIMEEIGVDPATIKSVYDLTEVFAKVKAKYPDMIPLVPVQTGNIGLITLLMSTQYKVDFLGDSYFTPVAVLIGDDMHVVNFYETQAFRDIVNLAREWYEKGYVLKDAATTTSNVLEFMSAGKAFAYIAAYAGNQAYTQISAQTGQPIRMVRLAQPYLSSTSVNALTWGVSTISKHPEAALKFINLLFTDKDVINLVIYGIEGRDYVKIDEYHVKYPEGKDASTVPYTAQLSCGIVGNQFIQYQMEGTDMDDLKLMEYELKHSAMSPAMGFTFDGSSVVNEYSAVVNVINEYVPGLTTGSMDPAEIPNFLEKLKSAGIEKIVAAKQQQLDEWLSTQK